MTKYKNAAAKVEIFYVWLETWIFHQQTRGSGVAVVTQ